MYNNEEKLQFIESIFERIPKDASIDVAQREIIGFLLEIQTVASCINTVRLIKIRLKT